MRTKLIFLQIILLCVLINPSLNGQTTGAPVSIFSLSRVETLRLADRLLLGDDTDIDYGKAALLFTRQARRGDAVAMTRLAGMYRQGLGVEQDNAKALALYRNAAKGGYGKAAYNIGVMYKHGEGVEQDFKKAFHQFRKSYKMGDKQKASQMLGYMSYKGLGTPQSYERALHYFHIGDSLGNPSSQYFIGLCYMAGNGVPQNIEEGKRWMEKALANGSEQASSFIRHERIKKYEPGGKCHAPQKSKVPEARNCSGKNLEGMWSGRLITHDWSGNKIVDEKPLQLTLQISGEGMSGLWVQDDSVLLRINGHLEDTQWVFDGMHYEDPDIHRPWDITSAQFQVDSTDAGEQLVGIVRQYSPATKEPSAPTSIALVRTLGNAHGHLASAIEGKESLRVSPNPFVRDVTIGYALAKSQEIRLTVTTLDGALVYKTVRQKTSGVHVEQLSLDVPTGVYLVRLEGSDVTMTAKMVKE
ncbi:MAG: T9SS type A sorting domain-containing protein [Paludibacteraceae bacterium]|nr:T9SS type A sorting domain-containing protein [Paludibacteraceae bacterium]